MQFLETISEKDVENEKQKIIKNKLKTQNAALSLYVIRLSLYQMTAMNYFQ